MEIVIAYCAAGLAIFVGIVHSYLGEKLALPPARAAPHFRVIRAVWHLPSAAWIIVGAALPIGVVRGEQILPAAIATLIFALSSFGNAWAVRRAHIGNLLLGVLALLSGYLWLA